MNIITATHRMNIITATPRMNIRTATPRMNIRTATPRMNIRTATHRMNSVAKHEINIAKIGEIYENPTMPYIVGPTYMRILPPRALLHCTKEPMPVIL